MTDTWKVNAFALATTTGVACVLCAIFDLLFPPYGMLAAFAPSSPWPITGSPIGFLIGFLTFTVAGFVLGALYGIAWEFWNRRLR
jgi:hypothetical protein